MPPALTRILMTLFVFCIATACAYYFITIQPVIEYSKVPIFDGYQYTQLTNHFAHESVWTPLKFPFNTRVGYPYITSLFGGAVLPSFLILNTLLQTLSMTLLFGYCLFKGVKWQIALVMFVWCLLHWMFPFRQQALDPIGIDSPTWFLVVLMSVLVVERKWLWLAVMLVVSTGIKEVFMALSVALCVWHFIFGSKKDGYLFLSASLLGFGILTTLRMYFPAYDQEAKHAFITVAFHIKEMVVHPSKIVFWIAAMFSALGVWWLPIIKEKVRLSDPLFWLFGSMLVLSFVGGDDYTRLICMSSPILFLMLMLSSKISVGQVLMMCVLGLPFCRIDAWILPVPHVDWEGYMSMFPEYSGWKITMYLIGYGVASTAFIFVLWNRLVPKK